MTQRSDPYMAESSAQSLSVTWSACVVLGSGSRSDTGCSVTARSSPDGGTISGGPNLRMLWGVSLVMDPDTAPVPAAPAIDEVFLEHYVRLVRALALTHELDDAADAVQDAFAAAAEQWQRIAQYEDPSGWIRRVAINNLRSRRRNQERRQSILRRWCQRSGVVDGRPDQNTSATPIRLDIRDAIRRLPEQQRIATALYYLADLSVAQVAATLNVSEGTVKSNLHDARASLRALIGDGYEQARA